MLAAGPVREKTNEKSWSAGKTHGKKSHGQAPFCRILTQLSRMLRSDEETEIRKHVQRLIFLNCLVLICVFFMLGKVIGPWVWNSYKDCMLGFIICFSYDIFYLKRRWLEKHKGPLF